MRALLACGAFFIAGIASGAPAALSAKPAANSLVRPAAAARAATSSTAARQAAVPVGRSVIRPIAPGATRPIAQDKAAPATLGGPSKYDAKKGAMLGGAAMPRKPH